MSAKVEYYLGGTSLGSLGINVESSTGVLDMPKMKAPPSTDWPDYHGAAVDLAAQRVQEREITLNCWLKAGGKVEFAERVNSLYGLLRRDGTTRLMVLISDAKPLVFEVYAPEGVPFAKRWREGSMIGTFTLKLREPNPVKRVVSFRHTASATTSAAATIRIASEKMVDIYWGDGTAARDIQGGTAGAPKTLTHTYSANGTYYIIVAGVIEEIAYFNTNGTTIWEKI